MKFFRFSLDRTLCKKLKNKNPRALGQISYLKHIVNYGHHNIHFSPSIWFISWRKVFCNNWHSFLCCLVLINEFCIFAGNKQKLVKLITEKTSLGVNYHLIVFFSLCVWWCFFLTIYKYFPPLFPHISNVFFI